MVSATLARPAARTREATVLGRLIVAVVAALPGIGSWLTRTGARARRLVLQVGGLGMIVWAAWLVAVPLGALAAGLALLTLEWLLTPEREPGR